MTSLPPGSPDSVSFWCGQGRLWIAAAVLTAAVIAVPLATAPLAADNGAAEDKAGDATPDQVADFMRAKLDH